VNRTCWTCLTEHDPDEACAPAPRIVTAGGGKSVWKMEEGFGEPFSAFYSGACTGECSGPIRRGDLIRRAPDGSLVHDGCEDE
jgi:hypothetical protein